MTSKALNRLTRRDLLRSGLIIGGGITTGAAAGMPSVLERVVYAATRENVKADTVVGLLQLAGGNDGLNTVIPLGGGLEQRRGAFGTGIVSQAIELNNDFGLHPSLKNIARRFQAGEVGILMDVGYPMMSKSHFVATQIWQRGDPTERQLTGAFGRLADVVDDQGHPLAFCGCGYNTVPGLMRGATPRTAVVPTNTASYGFKGGIDQALATLWKAGVPGPYGDLLTQFMAVARGTATQVKNATALYQPQGDYAGVANNLVFPSKNNLAQNLRVAASLIKGGAQLSVFTTTLGGYDDHSDEQARQSALHALFDTAVNAFLDDTAAAGKFPTVAIYSEFGRSIAVNNNAGTDHGAASPMIIVGRNVKGGIYGAKPNLAGYDVPFQIDFRQMYASLIQHLGVDPKVVLGSFAPIPFMKS